MNLNSLNINKSWSLFLDRDGVINQRIPDDYVKNINEFVFIDGSIDAITRFCEIFGLLFVVTNQQGVGKGLMSENTLDDIHSYMLKQIEKSGGCINKVYYSPDLRFSGSFSRKPNIGMGLKARKDFPDIDFKKSIMVGDTESDLKFGKRLGMKTVFISNDIHEIRRLHLLFDATYPTLFDLANALNI